MHNDLKYSVKATLDSLKAKKLNSFQWPRQSPDLNPVEQLFSYWRENLSQKDPHASNNWRSSHLQGGVSELGGVYLSQVAGSHWLQGFSSKSWKSQIDSSDQKAFTSQFNSWIQIPNLYWSNEGIENTCLWDYLSVNCPNTFRYYS